MNKNFFSLETFGFALLATILASQANAANNQTCGQRFAYWEGNQLTYEIHQDTFPNNADFSNTMQEAAQSIENRPGLDIDINTVNVNGENPSLGDGDNDIYFRNLGTFNGGANSTAIAVEYTITSVPFNASSCNSAATTDPGDAEILESDIVFDTRRIWTATPYDGDFSGAYDMRLTAVHEMMHSLGLGHQNNELSVMNEQYWFSGTIGYQHLRLPYADDLTGLDASYSDDNDSSRDLVASRYKTVPSVNGGRRSIRNEVKRASDFQPVSALTRGQDYFIDFSIENHQAANSRTNDVRVGFYLSSDGYISPSSDILIADVVYSRLSGRSSKSPSVSFTLNNSVPPGDYFIGYMIDDINSFSEIDGENNQVVLLLPNGSGRYTIN